MPKTIAFTNAGRAVLTNRIIGAGAEPKHVAWGTGAGSADPADVALAAEATEARTVATSSRQQTDVANDTYQVIGQMTCAGAGKSITEVGLFDAASAGSLFLRCHHDAVVLDVGEAIEYTFRLKF